ncbi:MAG: hypothetical protein R3293_25425, partial [Candidatus Promineifilaceae bacterium]|nr:hypothetical protein [Candidatus Promineifilaceae bacterium]
PTADHLIAAIPADIEADERYQADYQRLLASLLALRILGISGAQRQLIAYFYRLYRILPGADFSAPAQRVIINYGFERDKDSEPAPVIEEAPDQVKMLREDMEKLARVKRQLVAEEVKREAAVIKKKEKFDEKRKAALELFQRPFPEQELNGGKGKKGKKGKRKKGRQKGQGKKNGRSREARAAARRAEFLAARKGIREARADYQQLQRRPTVYQPQKDADLELLEKHDIQIAHNAYQAANQIDARMAAMQNMISRLEEEDCCDGFPVLANEQNTIKILGSGELIVVRDRLLRYEIGEVSHIDNVLKGERKSREHIYKKSTERIVEVFEEEESTLKSELETTSRFELNKEIQTQLSSRFDSEVSASGSGSYGPVANFEASAGVNVGFDSNLSTQTADSFSREVVNKAVEEIKKKTSQRTISRTLTEITDKNEHSFDNTYGGDHVSGVYCYVNRISCAQAYHYGRRLMLLAAIIHPAKDIRCIAGEADARRFLDIDAPPTFDVTLEHLNATNYRQEAGKFKVADVEPPPDQFIFLDKAFKTDQTSAQQEELSLKSIVEFILPYFKQYKKYAVTDAIKVPKGYQVDAVTVTVNHGSNGVSMPFGVIGALMAAPAALNAAGIPLALASLTMPSTQYNLDSSSVIVNVGNESKKSNYFFFDSEEIIGAMLEMANNVPGQMASMQSTMTTLENDLQQFLSNNFQDFFTQDLPGSASAIVSGQVNLLKNNLTLLFEQVKTMFNTFPTIGWVNPSPPGIPYPTITIDWNSLNTALSAEKVKIDATLKTAAQITDEFRSLLQNMNASLIQPFMAIFQNAMQTVAQGFNAGFVDPLQEAAEIFESSENLYFNPAAANPSIEMKGSIPISLNMIAANPGITVNVVIRARRTERAEQEWQLATYNKLYQGYVRLKEDYEASLYTSNLSSLPRANPALLRRLENDELKKYCIKALDRQFPSPAGAIDPQKLAFLDHALEWENMSYKLANYGVHCKDLELIDMGLLAIADEKHARFLKATAAHVMLPVRVEYTLAMQSYMKSGEWQEPELDDEEQISLYQQIINGAALADQPQKIGAPIPVNQPTSLIRVQKDLPHIADDCQEL